MKLPLLFAVLVSACSSAQAIVLPRASAASGTVDPNDDAFYVVPKTLSSYKPGQVIRRRAVTTSLTSKNIGASYQLMYRTNDALGNPASSITTIVVPAQPATQGPGGVLSYQVYEDSVQLDCSPSWALVNGTQSNNTGGVGSDNAQVMNWALDNGYYVNVPDHEGSKSAFFTGWSAGKHVLDSISALKRDQKLRKSFPITLFGYSGGAHATVWAENLATRYAPDLNITGSAHGGTPLDGRGLIALLNKGPFAGFAGAGIFGLMNGYASLDKYVSAHLLPAGQAARKTFTQRNYCLNSVKSGSPLVDFLSYINVTDPLNQPQIASILNRESLLIGTASEPVAVPTWPRFLTHGVADEIVPYADEQNYVQQQCARGANIAFMPLPGEHVTAEDETIPLAIQFLTPILAGKKPLMPDTCGLPLPAIPSAPTAAVPLPSTTAPAIPVVPVASAAPAL